LEEALEAYRQAVRRRPDDALSYGSLAGLYRKLGQQEAFVEAIAHARELMAEENEYNRACLEAIAGEAEQAVTLLQTALQKRQVHPGWVRQDPDFDFIRDHPSFQELLHSWVPYERGALEAPSVA
jgi:Flp pilus assembly protein TadD